MGKLVSSIIFKHTLWLGILIPTFLDLDFTISGTFSFASTTTVNGPGQNFSVILKNKS
tara:strand:- start:1160 stop:1333 length:174 start_codon:yes stop_codon:yes gene_type:complete